MNSELIDYLVALREVKPDISDAKLLHDANYVFGTPIQHPAPTINRLWELDKGEESVNSWGGRVWRIRDLLAAVKDQPVFELPLAHIPLKEHRFECPDIVEFARHMRHVQEADLGYPVVMDEYGWVMDGRHRIVRAMLEGATTIKCVRLPEGLSPSYYSTT